ncbi:acyltransferase [Siphonobacter sp. SORGH_AS_0500]|uniref:acyltransferase family protein n=1 Tax=Siphonobacter sp. SORGH_AS_0500 TaxID=1864824 RepID=UPI00286139ED|nr:acyltransferase [Siphonobacter sp. SORGH_AS_0500]MDR6194798.1 exopolysaccharide production protein ExoZ [Siphonobacter sp. SORGH_AS_0500]
MSSVPLSPSTLSNAVVRYNSIQMLRGLAAIVVTLYHISENISRTYQQTFLFDWFNIGYAGVDLFFVISGFIIAHTSAKYINQPRELVPYLEKRFYRVYPVYWFFVVPLLLAMLAIQKLQPALVADAYPFDWINLIKTLTLYPEHIALDAVTWTLSHEIYFYLLFALLLVSRHSAWILVALTLGTIVNSFYIFSHGWLFGSGIVRFFLLSPINLEFLFGVSVYYLHKRFRLNQFWLVILIGLLAAFYLAPRTGGDMTRVWNLGIPSLLIVWGFVEADRSHAYRVPNLLIHLGDASYVIYLMHFPVIVFANKLLFKAGFSSVWALGMADMGLMLLIFWLSWKIHKNVEMPIVKWSRGSAKQSAKK